MALKSGPFRKQGGYIFWLPQDLTKVLAHMYLVITVQLHSRKPSLLCLAFSTFTEKETKPIPLKTNV